MRCGLGGVNSGDVDYTGFVEVCEWWGFRRLGTIKGQEKCLASRGLGRKLWLESVGIELHIRVRGRVG